MTAHERADAEFFAWCRFVDRLALDEPVAMRLCFVWLRRSRTFLRD